MKKKITKTLLICLIFASNSMAQEFGLKAGISFNKWTYPDASSSNEYSSYEDNSAYLTGFHAGGTFEYGFNKHIGIATGLSFSQNGTKIESKSRYDSPYDNDYYESNSVSRIIKNTVEIPLVFKAGIYAGDFKIYGMFGGSMNLGINAKIESHSNSTESYYGEVYSTESSSSDELEYGPDGELTIFNASLLPGIGVEYKNIQLEATYSMGLTNMIGDSDESWKQNSIGISVGYKFGKKK